MKKETAVKLETSLDAEEFKKFVEFLKWRKDKRKAELKAGSKVKKISSNSMLADSLPSSCEHRYSRTMNQPYPRKCLNCGEVEKANFR